MATSALPLFVSVLLFEGGGALRFGKMQGQQAQLSDAGTASTSTDSEFPRIQKLEATKLPPGLQIKFPPWRTTKCPDGTRSACGTWKPYATCDTPYTPYVSPALIRPASAKPEDTIVRSSVSGFGETFVLKAHSQIAPLDLLQPLEDARNLDVGPTLDWIITKYPPDPNTLWLEFGVASGNSLRVLAACYKALGGKDKIWGFDSFRGLPEAWIHADGAPHQMMDHGGNLPIHPDINSSPHIGYAVGWINETLPLFLESSLAKGQKIGLLHVDVDIYSSTVHILRMATPFLAPGALLFFDEIFEVMHEEAKAFVEDIAEKHSWDLEYLGACKHLKSGCGPKFIESLALRVHRVTPI
jgi:hypothetical protein